MDSSASEQYELDPGEIFSAPNVELDRLMV
jgi:hypothetical protein